MATPSSPSSSGSEPLLEKATSSSRGSSGVHTGVVGRSYKPAALGICAALLLGASLFTFSTRWYAGEGGITALNPLLQGSTSSLFPFSASSSNSKKKKNRFLPPSRTQEEKRTLRPLKVYMYDTLPAWLDADIRTTPYPEGWLTLSEEYNGDLWMYNFIANASFRTLDPAEATLFYIPILPTRATHLKLDNLGWNNANKAAADLIKWGIHWISHHWPYWNRSNGADHFMTLTADHGRCNYLPHIPRKDWGDLFVVQHLGDTTIWYGDDDLPAKDGIKVELEDRWPCYRKGRDILIPAYIPEVPVISPFDTLPRGIGALWRFDNEAATSHYTYHNVKVRQELGSLFHREPIHGADWRLYQHINETTRDMTNSTACIAPPGVVAHTSRHWRSINSGCIPISYFRAYDLPFQDYIDHSKFSINIQPDSVNDTAIEVNSLLFDEKRVQAMQMELADAQKAFDWASEDGVARMMTRELQARSDDVQRRRNA